MENKDKLQDIKNKCKLANEQGEFHATHLTTEDIQWLITKAGNLENIEKAWRYGSGEDIDVALQEAFE